jgi:hypothetical protein
MRCGPINVLVPLHFRVFKRHCCVTPARSVAMVMGDIGGTCEIACEAISWFCDMANRSSALSEIVSIPTNSPVDGREVREV